MSISDQAPDHVVIEAAEWCDRVADGLPALEDQLAFEAWLDADPRHRSAFERMAAILLDARKVADIPELIDLRADALQSMRDANREKEGRMLLRRRPLLAAMAACLLLLLSGLVYQVWQRTDLYVTGVGERRVVMLADGSRVSLDASSRLEVEYDDARRNLRLLSGRAKFDVAKDPRRPFAVTAAGKQVVATGTAFSVELVTGQLRVILYEGHVAVLEEGPRDRPPRAVRNHRGLAADETLVPGKALILDISRAKAVVEDADPVRSLAWEGGQLVFTDERLDLAVQRVNRYSDHRLVVRGPAAAIPVSGAFNAGDAEGFVDGIEALYGLKAERSGRQIILTGPDGD
jgi:transmembrane sensor